MGDDFCMSPTTFCGISTRETPSKPAFARAVRAQLMFGQVLNSVFGTVRTLLARVVAWVVATGNRRLDRNSDSELLPTLSRGRRSPQSKARVSESRAGQARWRQHNRVRGPAKRRTTKKRAREHLSAVSRGAAPVDSEEGDKRLPNSQGGQ